MLSKKFSANITVFFRSQNSLRSVGSPEYFCLLHHLLMDEGYFVKCKNLTVVTVNLMCIKSLVQLTLTEKKYHNKYPESP